MEETEDYAEPAALEDHATTHQDGGDDEINVAALSGELTDDQNSAWHKVSGKPATFPPDSTLAHKASHEDTGTDEISVAALSGELADDQPPKAHALGGAKHTADTLADLNTKVSDATLDDSSDPRTPSAHKTSHHSGGTDRINVAGLSGQLTDSQPPKDHALGGTKHTTATLAELNSKISDATLDDSSGSRTPSAHKSSHEDGGTDEIDAQGLLGRINLVDRGDPAVDDFDTEDFTTTFTWVDLNLSEIVPAGAIAVLLTGLVKDNLTDVYIQFRKNGNTNTKNRISIFTQVANINLRYQIVVFCDANQIIEYRTTNTTFTTLSLTVQGWYI